MQNLMEKIRSVPDFPKAGINFKDITTLVKDGPAFKQAIELIAANFDPSTIDLIAGIEARGFVFGAALAYKWNKGFVLIRKPGKLPAETESEEYALEYGSDRVEVHRDAISKQQRILIVDDLLATGGTVKATVNLVEKLGGKVAGIAFLIELDFLKGREKLKGHNVFSLIHYTEE